VQTLSAAFKFLTVWGCVTSAAPARETIGKAAGYFIYVGLVLGLLLALTNYLLAPYLAAESLSLVLVTILIAVTGAQHMNGVKNTFDALITNDKQADGALGFAAVALVILFKSAAADSMDEKLSLSLLLTPVLARWALLIFLYGYHMRFDETARAIAARVNLPPVLASTAATLAFMAYFLGRKGLWIALAVSLFTLLLRSLLHRRHAALSQANLGAAVELAEALSLTLLASF
jgi:adenosylcobinamide-GDP ribazoletransferase